MKNSDVLIFPTLIDAFGMVISEAMSQGTPVITTFNSGGPELITHNEDGWLIEAGNSDAIKNILENLLTNRNLTKEFGQNSLVKAEQRSWQDYQNDVCTFITSLES